MDPNNLPSENAAVPVSKDDAAVAAVGEVIKAQDAALQKAEVESRAIADPTLPPKSAPETTGDLTPAKPEKPATLEGASVDTLSPELLQRAAAVNISQAEAERLGSAATRRILSGLENQQSQQTVQAGQPFAFDPYTGQPLQPPKPAADEIDLPKTYIDPESGEERTIVWNPGLVEAIKKTNSRALAAEQRAEKIEQLIQQQHQREHQQYAQSVYSSFDEWAKARTDLHDVIGQGDRASVTQPEAQARIRLLARAEKMWEADGHKAMPRDATEYFEQAEASLYRGKIAAKAANQARQEVSDKLRDAASGRFVNKPTATTRSNDLPKGDARAVAAVAAKLREQGYESY